MERDGYESDKNRLFVLDLQTGEKTYLTENFDYIVNTFAWAPDAGMIYFTAPYQGMVHVFSVALNGLAIQQRERQRVTFLQKCYMIRLKGHSLTGG